MGWKRGLEHGPQDERQRAARRSPRDVDPIRIDRCPEGGKRLTDSLQSVVSVAFAFGPAEAGRHRGDQAQTETLGVVHHLSSFVARGHPGWFVDH